MAENDDKSGTELEKQFGEALARFIRSNPANVAETIAGDILKQHEAAKRRIESVRRELEDGGRPRKGRFSL